jgi:hypothetical protein
VRFTASRVKARPRARQGLQCLARDPLVGVGGEPDQRRDSLATVEARDRAQRLLTDRLPFIAVADDVIQRAGHHRRPRPALLAAAARRPRDRAAAHIAPTGLVLRDGEQLRCDHGAVGHDRRGDRLARGAPFGRRSERKQVLRRLTSRDGAEVAAAVGITLQRAGISLDLHQIAPGVRDDYTHRATLAFEPHDVRGPVSRRRVLEVAVLVDAVHPPAVPAHTFAGGEAELHRAVASAGNPAGQGLGLHRRGSRDGEGADD